MTAVCVVGLGKIGLPLAVQYASSGCAVHGADRSAAVVDSVNGGMVHFPGEAYLEDRLADAVARRQLCAETDTAAAVARSEVVVVVVPLLLDGADDADFTAIDEATASIADGLRPGTLVLYETTVPVFTTRRRLGPALARRSGLTIGEDLFVAYSPERVYSGRIFEDLRRYPKLVGGLDDASGRRAVAFYEQVLQFDERADLDRPNGVWDLGSAEAAELAKLAETTYRDVNIALANELAAFAERAGIDVLAVIAAANSQPFSHLHRPGIAVGGHCIPVYPRLLLQEAPEAQLPRVARAVNDAAPVRSVARLAATLGGLTGCRVVVLGATYRGGVKETERSGVFAVVDSLQAAGAGVTVHDPLLSDGELLELGLAPHRIGEPVEAVVVQADHEVYRDLGPEHFPGARAVLDGRGVLDASRWRARVHLMRVGVGEQ